MEGVEITYVVVLVVQLLYMTIYSISIGTYKAKPNELSNVEPVSIIICAFNELENLKVLVPKLLTQVYSKFEIIIVNDQSIDGTYEYLMELKQNYNNIKMVQIDQTPDHFSRKKFGLTLGVKAATNERLLFTDADCYPHDDQWLSVMNSQYDKDIKIVLGTSMYEVRRGFLNKFIRYETCWTAIQYIGLAIAGLPYMGVGRNLSYRKSLFLENKGFSEHQNVIGGDDDLFVNRHAKMSNTSVAIGSSALTYSYPKISFSDLWRQKLRHMSVGKYYKFKHKIILGIYSLSSLLFWALTIGLIFAQPQLVGAGLLIRVIMLYVLFFVTSGKLGKRFVPLTLALLDIVYVFYYIAIGVSAVFSKKTKWR